MTASLKASVKKPKSRMTKVEAAANARASRTKDQMGGRPPKLVIDEKTLETIDGLGKIQSTNEEAAAVLGVSRVTFEKFLGDNKTAADAFQNAKGSGKTSLRRAQFKAALGGNATMLVWLGKQMLDQKDKSEIDNRVRFSFDEMSAEELREYVKREAAELGVGHAAPAVPRGKGKTGGSGRSASLH
jgi:hypothetical protein